MSLGLGDMLAGWSPAPVTAAQKLVPGPAQALAGVLDQDSADLCEGAMLPPLWQWLYFLDHPAQADLGEDGHPRDGHFLPPIPDRRRMIAGGRLDVRQPIRIGEQVQRHSRLADVRIKEGRSGAMAFVTVRHEFLVAGDVRAVEEQDVVHRSQPPGTRRSLTRPPAPHDTTHWQLPLTATETMLFRFSALTYNGHRIHYDHPYVTEVEGYPGLVVHGPLLAILMLEIPRRLQAEQMVRSLSFRLHAPAFAGEALTIRGRRTTGTDEDTDIELHARTADALIATAAVRF